MKELYVFAMGINAVAVWIELGRAMNPELPAAIRKRGAVWALICSACFVINYLAVTK